jgi:hypothetical protein
MAIVGGFDIHRGQDTFDYLDTVTGQVRRGRIAPACRETLRHWLERFAGCEDVTFAVEGCTGWRFVVEELQRAGITADAPPLRRQRPPHLRPHHGHQPVTTGTTPPTGPGTQHHRAALRGTPARIRNVANP